jgi:hypothetical protein
MRTLSRFYRFGLLSVALLAPLAVSPTALRADDDDHRREKHYRDSRHNDDHVWNDHEDRAYRMWVQENHRKYNDFNRLKDRDRQNYWDWRHDHSDAQLKIDIR